MGACASFLRNKRTTTRKLAGPFTFKILESPLYHRKPLLSKIFLNRRLANRSFQCYTFIMNKIILPLLLTCTFLSVTAHAEQVITLKDGSQIKGELIGITDGLYTIKTPIIGAVHVAASDVVNISNAAAAPVALPQAAAPANVIPAASLPSAQQMQNAQAQLMANPMVMQDMQQLAQDPEIMQMLSDPELVKAVTSHDASAVANNPKAQALMNNPKMRALIEKLRGNGALPQQ